MAAVQLDAQGKARARAAFETMERHAEQARQRAADYEHKNAPRKHLDPAIRTEGRRLWKEAEAAFLILDDAAEEAEIGEARRWIRERAATARRNGEEFSAMGATVAMDAQDDRRFQSAYHHALDLFRKADQAEMDELHRPTSDGWRFVSQYWKDTADAFDIAADAADEAGSGLASGLRNDEARKFRHKADSWRQGKRGYRATMNLRTGRMQAFDVGPPGKAINVGQWDRFATEGYKQKEGEPADFTADNLGKMVTNWYARGQRLPMCLDHRSALQGMVTAPAAAFYDALAVVSGGKVSEFKKLGRSTADPPDPAQLTAHVMRFSTDDNPKPSVDGLWGYRCEVTPLGEHPTEGLRNYRGISPLFTMDGTNEQEEKIGPTLFDVAAVNTNFQGGCELSLNQFDATGDRSRVTSALAHAKEADREASRAHVALGPKARSADYERVARQYQDASNAYDVAIDALKEIENSGSVSAPWARQEQTLTERQRRDTATQADLCRQQAQKAQQYGATEFGGLAMGLLSLKAGDKVRSVLDGDTGTVTSVVGSRVEITWSKHGPIAYPASELNDSDFQKMSTTTSAARAFGENMNPELMAKMGIADGDDAAKKMAAYMRYAYEASPEEIKAMAEDLDKGDDKAKGMAAKMRRMGENPFAKKDEDDKDKKDEMAAFSSLAVKFGLPAGAPRLQVLTALAAGSVPTSALPALIAEQVKLAVAEEGTKRDAETKVQQLGQRATAARYPGDVPALMLFARGNFAEAEKMIKPFEDQHAVLFGRLTPSGIANRDGAAPTTVERNGVVRFGVDLAGAVKAYMKKNPGVGYIAASDAVIAEQPQLAQNYYNR